MPSKKQPSKGPARSKRQAEASRFNGTKSRGPMPGEGRAKSAQNSRKHGLTGKINPSAAEQDGIDELIAKLKAQFDANDAEQAGLIERVIMAELRLNRARLLITATLEDIAAPASARLINKRKREELIVNAIRDHMRQIFASNLPDLKLAKMMAERAGLIEAPPRANRTTLSRLMRYARRFRGERNRALLLLQTNAKLNNETLSGNFKKLEIANLI